MSTHSKIEWTDKTWNPVRGCSLVSAGCANCYAMKQAHRFSGKDQPYEGLTEIGPHGPRWTGQITLVPNALDEPLRWRKPCRVFVNSMSDLFHEAVPDDFIDRVFAVMALMSEHTFQILTKRPQRMLRYLTCHASGGRHVWSACQAITLPNKRATSWPLPNVWLGVSIEDQKTADERIAELLQTPAAVRFVSYEPALGPVDLTSMLEDYRCLCGGAIYRVQRPAHHEWHCSHCGEIRSAAIRPGVDWVIVGGESGPGARPCDVAWVRSIVQQCQAAGVPVFVKQLGTRPVTSEVVFDTDRGINGQTVTTAIVLRDKKGGEPAEWPTDLRVREFPESH